MVIFNIILYKTKKISAIQLTLPALDGQTPYEKFKEKTKLKM